MFVLSLFYLKIIVMNGSILFTNMWDNIFKITETLILCIPLLTLFCNALDNIHLKKTNVRNEYFELSIGLLTVLRILSLSL